MLRIDESYALGVPAALCVCIVVIEACVLPHNHNLLFKEAIRWLGGVLGAILDIAASM